jgi:integrase
MRFLDKDELAAMVNQSVGLDRLMILLSFNHGLRVSEVLSLTSNNFVDGHLIIQRLKGSLKTIQKLLPNEAGLVSDLLAHRKVGEKLIPFTRRTAHRHIKAIGIAAGVPAFRATPHALKHATAKIGLAGGMTLPEVQTRLGHKSGASTMIYLKTDDSAADMAFETAVGL